MLIKIYCHTVIFLFFVITLSAEPVISTIAAPDKKEGTNFYPFFVGAKWIWQTEGMGSLQQLTWELISCHSIIDTDYGMNNVTTYKLKVKELNSVWYVMENDGYICNYKPENTKNRIEKILPVHLQLSNTWSSAGLNYAVTSLEENMVRIDYKSPDESRSGYMIFIDETGPYTIADKIKDGTSVKDTLLTLKNHLSYQELKKNSSTTASIKTLNNQQGQKKDTEIGNEITDYHWPESSLIELTKNDFIMELTNGRKYIQVGAFNILYFAQELLFKVRENGFSAKIYRDKKGFFKIMVEAEGDGKKNLNEIQNRITKDAFLVP